MPAARQSAAVAVLGEQIFLIGGRRGTGDTGQATNTVEVFDTATGDWSKRASLRVARTSSQAVVLNSRIFVVGGAQNDRAVETIEVFDPRHDSWGTGPNLRQPRSSHSVLASGDRLLVIGGATSASASSITGGVEEIVVAEP